jgi:helicase required for RNAi-mediated heterochromatin assembly 1
MDEYYDGEFVEEQENEELKRLKELTEIADYSGDEEENENDAIEKQTSDDTNDKIDTNDLIDFANWSWNLSQQDRLIKAARLIRFVTNLIKHLNKIVTDNNLVLARRSCSEAGAKLFRNARIIGSTVVGASRRLEALRSAGPFAVVIEEACEVIEPTLISVLAVNTLRKLEMIGDHRQLPAFVQQCWFNFETTLPSIKTSLFERLITGQVKSTSTRESNAAAILPHTVLDEQRRMRSSIADITRPDYNDLVEILDHHHTSVQCVGDVVLRSCVDDRQVKYLAEHRSTWPDNGRSVPGLSQNIYFWDLLNNSESRPIAGLSACNQNEAEAVAYLTKWLLLCGCPPASISIITPYKGQKTAITLALRKNNCLPSFRYDKPPARGTTITISTVDRYQGDENDIVILSLVRCNPGNRFVGLQNRFVVAMSRARLGFFVIGSVKAVVTNRNGTEGPSHWRRFISSLTQIDENKVN